MNPWVIYTAFAIVAAAMIQLVYGTQVLRRVAEAKGQNLPWARAVFRMGMLLVFGKSLGVMIAVFLDHSVEPIAKYVMFVRENLPPFVTGVLIGNSPSTELLVQTETWILEGGEWEKWMTAILALALGSVYYSGVAVGKSTNRLVSTVMLGGAELAFAPAILYAPLHPIRMYCWAN